MNGKYEHKIACLYSRTVICNAMFGWPANSGYILTQNAYHGQASRLVESWNDEVPGNAERSRSDEFDDDDDDIEEVERGSHSVCTQ